MDTTNKRPAEEQAPDDKLEKKTAAETVCDEDLPDSIFDDEARSILHNRQRLARSRNRDRELLLKIKELVGNDETAKSISNLVGSVNLRGLFTYDVVLKPEPIPETTSLEDIKNAVNMRLQKIIDKTESIHGDESLHGCMFECQSFISSLFAARPSKVPVDPSPAVKEALSLGLPKFADFLSRVPKLLKETEKFYRLTH